MFKESLDKSSGEEKGEFNAGFVYFNSFHPEFGRWTNWSIDATQTAVQAPVRFRSWKYQAIKTMHMYQFSRSKNEQSAIKPGFHTVSLKRDNSSHG
ncbi:MAG: hypothetical protein ABS69_10540 [Nitrosomonadales bacterium SCN 54-20]|nr:MAG: hypothetical protein ABS69_10540 [Nitrosomonadales bacterium SCN 54-20]